MVVIIRESRSGTAMKELLLVENESFSVLLSKRVLVLVLLKEQLLVTQMAGSESDLLAPHQ